MPLSYSPDLTPDSIEQPLCSIECEEAILGGALFDPNAIGRIADVLPPEAFFVAAHQHIYRAALTLHRDGGSIDMLSVIMALRDEGILKDVGGQSKIMQLAQRVVSAANIDQYAAVVADKYVRRQLRQYGISSANAAADTATDLQSLLTEAYNGLESVRSMRPVVKPRNGEELGGEWFEIYTKRLSGDYKDPRFTTELYDLDDQLQGGVRPTEQLVTLLADTGCGKTTLALQMAWEISSQTTEPVIFFSLEMGWEELTDRLISLVSGVRMERHDSLSEAESSKVLEAWTTVSSRSNFYIDDTAEKISDIREIANSIAQTHGGQVGAIFVDYVQLIKPESETKNKVQDYDTILKELKRLTRKKKGLSTSVFILSQVSRTIRDRQNKRPTKHDGLWCSSIEQDSNIVLSVYRDEIYNPETMDRGIAEIAVLKNRSGPLGTVRVLYQPDLFRFVSLVARPSAMRSAAPQALPA